MSSYAQKGNSGKVSALQGGNAAIKGHAEAFLDVNARC